ncbi:MAG: guanylate kinase [Oscillospiraceae bacterium]|nr:guanylate kinase [Oscillospiraceae bacterium]
MTKKEVVSLALTSKGVLVVLSGPSGCGKDTVLKMLKEKVDFQKTVSATTRKMRDYETDGVDYYFITEEDFLKKIDDGYFVEYTYYNNNYYGTPKCEVESRIEKGGIILLKIEVKGADNIRKLVKDAVSVFIIPPSLEELEKRLRGRGTETEETFRERFEIAKEELRHASEYDYVVINDDVDLCADRVMEILRAEQFRYARMENVVNEILK